MIKVFWNLNTGIKCYEIMTTQRHWNGVKHVLRYLHGMIDMRLFYTNWSNPQIVGYNYTIYLSDAYKGQSQTKYLFFCGNNTTIFMEAVKQIKIIAIHEASSFHQNSFIHMGFKRAEILMLSRFDQVIIWLFYSLNHCQLQYWRR